MKLKQWLLQWSRKLHRWISLYIVALVLISGVEAIALPAAFSSGLPIVNGIPPIHALAANTNASLSLEQATKAFILIHPNGIDSLSEADEIAYLPNLGIYRFENKKRFFEWYIDAYNGKLLKYGFNANRFLEQQGLLGWLHPWIGKLIKLPSALFILILVISGFCLFISPFLTKKNRHISNS